MNDNVKAIVSQMEETASDVPVLGMSIQRFAKTLDAIESIGLSTRYVDNEPEHLTVSFGQKGKKRRVVTLDVFSDTGHIFVHVWIGRASFQVLKRDRDNQSRWNKRTQPDGIDGPEIAGIGFSQNSEDDTPVIRTGNSVNVYLR